MSIKKEIKNLIEKSLISLYPDFDGRQNQGIEVLVEVPKEKTHGDYSTNIALVLAKKLNKSPNEVATNTIKQINYSNVLKNIGIEKVEVAGPGFINFYLSEEFFADSLKKIDKNFGRNNNLKNQKIIIEYTDPNILKEFHIGHLMSNTIGESISRIVDFHGAKIKKICYQGDVGLHVAKAIWGKLKEPSLSWGEAYAYGSMQYEDNVENVRNEITILNKKIFERKDKKINKLYDEGKKWSLENFDKIYKVLGTRFDFLFFESQTAVFGKKIVEEGLKRGVFERGDNGAVIFKGEKYGLHTRVFINSEGLPTYEAKELGLAKVKYQKYKYDKSVIVTANEQNEYFKVVMSAMAEIFPELKNKSFHIGHGMMRLPEGKMSSRTGKVITFEFLLSEVKKLVAEKLKDRKLSDAEKEEIKEKVAIGALKYSILKQSIGSDIIYDFEKSISFDGDSGPYLQYSYARANSVLQKAKSERIKPSFKNIPEEIGSLEKLMHRFPDIVEEAGKNYEPHIIATYIIELAREFNNYYAKNKIVDKDDEFSPYKVVLTEAFSTIIKNGLWLLGIPAPEKM